MKKIIFLSIIILILIASILIVGNTIWKRNQVNAPTGPVLSKEQQTAQQPAKNNLSQQTELLSQAEIQQLSTKTSALMFDKQQQQISVGADFTLKAIVEPKDKKISASGLYITFNPKMLKLNSIIPLEEFSLVLGDPQIDNEKGTASIELGVPLEKPSLSSISTIAEFNFQALSAKGKTTIDFSDRSGASNGGKTNIVKTLVPTTIIIQ